MRYFLSLIANDPDLDTLPGANEYRASVDLVNGTFHDLLLEYKEETGAASIQVCRLIVLCFTMVCSR